MVEDCGERGAGLFVSSADAAVLVTRRECAGGGVVLIGQQLPLPSIGPETYTDMHSMLHWVDRTAREAASRA